MERCLLSVDWDYFIYTRNPWGSYIENNRSLMDFWYKRYIQAKARGEDIQKAFRLSATVDAFWANIKRCFQWMNHIKTYVSDSHALSYDIAKENHCTSVYLFDAHADLGYGGPSSLQFEVNCSNWLGKLLKDKQIKEAYIFYSPYTMEKPDHFKQINRIYNVKYCSFNDLNKKLFVSAIHICRSGAWTPPWLDEKFTQFINAMGISYEIMDCPARKWDTKNLSFSQQINYLMA